MDSMKLQDLVANRAPSMMFGRMVIVSFELSM